MSDVTEEEIREVFWSLKPNKELSSSQRSKGI